METESRTPFIKSLLDAEFSKFSKFESTLQRKVTASTNTLPLTYGSIKVA